MASNQGLPASLKTRDTPIGRAALARRRKRASALAGDSPRLVPTPTNETESEAEEEDEMSEPTRAGLDSNNIKSNNNSGRNTKFSFSESTIASRPPKYGSGIGRSNNNSSSDNTIINNGYSNDGVGEGNNTSRMGNPTALDHYKQTTHDTDDINVHRLPPTQDDDNNFRRNRSETRKDTISTPISSNSNTNNSRENNYTLGLSKQQEQQEKQSSVQLSSRELIEKSSLVAETAANILESARKSSSARKQQHQERLNTSSPQHSIDTSERSTAKQSLTFSSIETPFTNQQQQVTIASSLPHSNTDTNNNGKHSVTTDYNSDNDTFGAISSTTARSLNQQQSSSSSQQDTNNTIYNNRRTTKANNHKANVLLNKNENDISTLTTERMTTATDISLKKSMSSSSSQRGVVYSASISSVATPSVSRTNSSQLYEDHYTDNNYSDHYHHHEDDQDHLQYIHRPSRHYNDNDDYHHQHQDECDDEDDGEVGYINGQYHNRPMTDDKGLSNDNTTSTNEIPMETLEDLEPIINPDTEILDASCLRNGSWVMIRSKAQSETVTIDLEKTRKQESLKTATATSTFKREIHDTNNNYYYNRPVSSLHADLTGYGIGIPDECFQIIKLTNDTQKTDNHDNSDNVASRNNNGGIATTNNNNINSVVRYGDTVVLLSQLYDRRPLGVRKIDSNKFSSSNGRSVDDITTGSGRIYDIGLFRNTIMLESSNINHDNNPVAIANAAATIASADKWTILRGGTNHSVKIGRLAIEAASTTVYTNASSSIHATVKSSSTTSNAEKNKDKNNNNKSKGSVNISTTDKTTAAIRSSEQILLRNVLSGGYLSISRLDGKLDIITDSYQVNPTQSRSTSLLDQLQVHEILLPTNYQTFHFLTSSVPPLPRWVFNNDEQQRIYRNQSYLVKQQQQQEERLQQQSSSFADIFSTPVGQERVLLDQVIGALLGLEGPYIRTKRPTSNKYDNTEIDNNNRNELFLEFHLIDQETDDLDISLCQLIDRILPLATSYIRLSRFVSNHFPGYEYGSVMHAFCETIDCMLQDYIEFVTRLETPYRQLQEKAEQNNIRRLTMQQLYVHIQPLLHSMSIICRSTIAVQDKIGGALINTLSELKNWVCEGDAIATNILQILIEKTSLPYMKMLTIWLRQGELRDPYNEFMIEFSHERNEFVVRNEHILQGLKNTSVLTQKIVATGKYWQAVRICEKNLPSSSSSFSNNNNQHYSNKDEQEQQHDEVQLLRYSLDFASSGKSSFIQSMYSQASNALIQLLMNDFQLMESLRVMKRYFLLDQGDFIAHFLDSAQDELLKDSPDVSVGRIQHLLRMSVQLTEGLTLDQDSYYTNDEGERDNDSSRSKRRRCPLSPLALRCHFVQGSLIDHLDILQDNNTAILKSSSTATGITCEQMTTPGGMSSVGYSTTPFSSSSYSSRSTHYQHTSIGKNKSSGKSSKQLTGVEAFVVEFPQVPFPISMVLTNRSLANYQLLFRLLFFAKHVERRLVNIWRDHQVMKELSSLLRGSFGQTFLLRQRMLHFSQNLIYYIMFEVIEPNWLEMERAINVPYHNNHKNHNGDHSKSYNNNKRRWQQQQQKQQTVDDIVDIHDEFLGRTLEACLLTNRDLVRTLTKLIKTCIMFSDQMKLFMEATKIYDDSYNIAVERQKAIQRTLNNRLAGVGGNRGLLSPNKLSATSSSTNNHSDKNSKKNALREAMNTFKQERQARTQKQMHRVGRELSSESYRRMVSRFDEVFSAYLAEFMIQLSNSDATGGGGSGSIHKTNLCIRLDYNCYLSSSVSGLNKYS